MKWVDKPGVLGYLIECYAGTEGRKRQFIWEEDNGDVVIGNSRAFTDHVSAKFDLHLTSTAWAQTHAILRQLGEVVHEYSPRVRHRGTKFHNQDPEIRVLKRRK